MKIYDLLFYATYKVMRRSPRFNGTPVFGSAIYIGLCFHFNLCAIYFILHGFNLLTIKLPKEIDTLGSILYGLLILLLLFLYYKRNNRYKWILSKYENKRLLNSYLLSPFLIIIIYYTISFLIMLIAAMFMKRAWIFG